MTTKNDYEFNFAITNSFANIIEVPAKTPNKSDEPVDALEIKVYTRRWLMLLLITLFAIGNKFQILQYTIILDVITKHYEVSTLAVQSTSVVFNLTVPIMLYPCILIINRWGLRYPMIIISLSTCLGSWIKYLGAAPDLFALTMIGQTLVGICQVFMISLPAELVAKWFGPTEVAMATALAYMGPKFGVAAMTFLVPWIVDSHDDMDETTRDLRNLLLPQAIFCSCVAVLVFMFFINEPKLPPSKSRALQKVNQANSSGFWISFLRLLKNKNYCLLWVAQGLMHGQIAATSSLLNILYISHFVDGHKEVGTLALITLLSGLVGGILFSKMLDATKKFKEMAVSLYAGTILSVIFVAFSFYVEVKGAIFVGASIYGLFSFGYVPIACELSAEITYPESESFCTAILKLGDSLFSILTILISNRILSYFNDMATYMFLLLLLQIGFVSTILTDDVRNRHTAGNDCSSTPEEKY